MGLLEIGLLILFVGLKLSHIIDWSWWWVLSPIWICLLLYLLITIFHDGIPEFGWVLIIVFAVGYWLY
jgi:hypothetical protein